MSDRRALEWDLMTELIALVLTTGAIQQCAPQSLLIVGEPGSGKTALVERFADDDDASFNGRSKKMGNLSAWGLRNFLKLEVPRGVSHLIAPEFQTLFMRRADTWAAVEGLLLQAMAEGVGDYYNGPEAESYGNAKLGLVACMTRDAYMSVRSEFKKTGLSSRFLIVRWARTKRQVEEAIRRKARGDASQLSKVNLGLPLVKRPINIQPNVTEAILEYCKETRSDEMNRAYERFVALARAAAFRRGSRVATSTDWKRVLEHSRFWTGEV